MFKGIPVENKHFKDLNPVICGYHATEPGHNPGLTLVPYYLIHYVKKGKGTLETEGRRYEIGQGKIFIIKKNNASIYEADKKEPWEYIWIGFDGEFAEKLDGLDEAVFDFDGSLFDEIADAEKFDNMRSEYLAARVFDLMAKLFENTQSDTRYVKTAKDYIKSSYMRPLKVDEIADMLNLNRRYLSRVFKKETGITLKSYIIKTKMKKAEEFLKCGYSVGTVAEMVGYDDVFNFSKMFKKEMGAAPKFFKH